MLDIASQMRFGDGHGLMEFFLAHRLAHAASAKAIASKFNVTVPGFDVGDERARAEWELLMLRAQDGPKEPSRGLKDWLALHSFLHQAEYNAIGAGVAPDLIEVNFAQPDEFASWMLEHQQAHDVVDSTLGIA